MMKIDVEGFEANVIQGAPALLVQPLLQAVLIELNGLGARYGFSDADIHARLLDFGFHPVRYEPFDRRLVALGRGTRMRAIRFTFSRPRRWSSGCGERSRRGSSEWMSDTDVRGVRRYAAGSATCSGAVCIRTAIQRCVVSGD
jgi:hypothetical protein